MLQSREHRQTLHGAMTSKRPVIKKYWLATRSLAEMAFSRNSYLRAAGWWKSLLEGRSVDARGDALPWITYPCIGFLENRVRSNMAVFEYGSGNSTLWWAARTASVTSCEHDPVWYEHVKLTLPVNATLKLSSLADGAYAREILAYRNAFDVVVIDGRDRVKCAVNAIDALKSDGVIIWDNTDRTEYINGFQMLDSLGFKRLDFIGMSPLVLFQCSTSIFYRPSNCFGV